MFLLRCVWCEYYDEYFIALASFVPWKHSGRSLAEFLLVGARVYVFVYVYVLMSARACVIKR